MKRFLVLFVFFLSGAAGLIYQIVWMRKLTLLLGSAAGAVSTVLAVFMGGLSLGAWLLGRYGDRVKSPIAWYALIELAIAVFGVLSGHAIAGLQGTYVSLVRGQAIAPALLGFVRFVFAVAALIVPTTLMGATLPILLRGMSRDFRKLGYDAGLLYSINTLGAFVGTVLTALLLIRTLGLQAGLVVAACLNLAAGLIALAAIGARQSRPVTPSTAEIPVQEHGPESNRAMVRTVEIALLLSGFLGLAYEVLWTRHIIYVLAANSVYAFSAVLAAVLFGILLGSYAAALAMKNGNPTARVFGLLLVFAGIAALLTTRIMWLMAQEFISNRMFLSASIVMFVKSVAILLLPTAIRGSTFAVAARICVRSQDRIGTDTGRLYGLNTFGAIFGALAGGFVILPLLGLKAGLITLASLDIAVGLFVILRSERRIVPGRRTVFVGLLGVIAYVSAILAHNPVEQRLENNQKIIFQEDGPESSVLVVESPDGNRSLVVDGDVQAGSDPTSLLHLRLLGHLPVMLHGQARDVLVIALGGGITAGSILCHPVERVDIVELSRVVPKATALFGAWNNQMLEDKRVNLIHDDGRNYLLTTTNMYDVITTDPLDPDDAGMTSLYSLEYYKLVRSRLRPGGVACQWLVTRLKQEDYMMLVRTFSSVFPSCMLWNGELSTILVGLNGDSSATYDIFAAEFERPAVKRSLAPMGLETPEQLLALKLAGPGQIRRFVGEGPLNTDDRPLIEYASSLIVRQTLELVPEFRTPTERGQTDED
ncbi:MAG: hypothetical protein E4H02_04450 [Lentisphaerales bacterium]|nr:MAG: hypothetical protein E4H02_04450 [Lentisphaerales bacterium]